MRRGKVLDGKADADGHALSQQQGYEVDYQEAHVVAPLQVRQQTAWTSSQEQADRDNASRNVPVLQCRSGPAVITLLAPVTTLGGQKKSRRAAGSFHT